MPGLPMIAPTNDAGGCAYLLGVHVTAPNCGRPRRLRSSYCEEHHALCHVASGSTAEAARLREAEALAYAVGGRQGWRRSQPSRPFLRRLQQFVRDLQL
jgi:hypothetical protein